MLTLEFAPNPDDPVDPLKWWYIAEVKGEGRRKAFEPSAALTEEEYERLLRALRDLYGLAGHNSIAVLERNTTDLVKAMTPATVSGSDRAFAELRFQLQVALVNWLGSWRVYLEHAKSLISTHFGGKSSPQLVEWHRRRTFEFDRSRAYQLIEGLRDFAIHAGLPPVAATAGGGRVHLAFQADELRERWSGWKSHARGILLDNRGRDIEIARVVSEGMESIRRLDESLYSLARPRIDQCVAVLLDASERIADPDPNRIVIVAGDRAADHYVLHVREVPGELLVREALRLQVTSCGWHAGAVAIVSDSPEATSRNRGTGSRRKAAGSVSSLRRFPTGKTASAAPSGPSRGRTSRLRRTAACPRGSCPDGGRRTSPTPTRQPHRSPRSLLLHLLRRRRQRRTPQPSVDRSLDRSLPILFSGDRPVQVVWPRYFSLAPAIPFTPAAIRKHSSMLASKCGADNTTGRGIKARPHSLITTAFQRVAARFRGQSRSHR